MQMFMQQTRIIRQNEWPDSLCTNFNISKCYNNDWQIYCVVNIVS